MHHDMHHRHGRHGFGFGRPGGFGLGMGGGLLSDLLAGGLGYYLGQRSAQGNASYPAYGQRYGQPPLYSSQDPANQRMAQLQQLGQLRESGVLTEEEFQLEKQRILAGS